MKDFAALYGRAKVYQTAGEEGRTDDVRKDLRSALRALAGKPTLAIEGKASHVAPERGGMPGMPGGAPPMMGGGGEL